MSERSPRRLRTAVAALSVPVLGAAVFGADKAGVFDRAAQTPTGRSVIEAKNHPLGASAAAEAPTTTLEIYTTVPGFDGSTIPLDQAPSTTMDPVLVHEALGDVDAVNITPEDAVGDVPEAIPFTPDNILYQTVAAQKDAALTQLKQGVGNWHLEGSPKRDKDSGYYSGKYSNKTGSNDKYITLGGRFKGDSLTDPEASILPDSLEFGINGEDYSVSFFPDYSTEVDNAYLALASRTDTATNSMELIPALDALTAFVEAFPVVEQPDQSVTPRS